jgi:hypothetical protein
MSLLETTPATEILPRVNGKYDRKTVNVGSLLLEENSETRLPAKHRAVLPSRVAMLGNYLPPTCVTQSAPNSVRRNYWRYP